MPRKVAKAKARSLYRRLVRKGEVTPEQLLSAIMAFSAVMTETDPKYICYPATWLSQGRWDDDLSYLTFLPDFTPRPLLERLSGFERALEGSRFRSWSAHYVARLVKRRD